YLFAVSHAIRTTRGTESRDFYWPRVPIFRDATDGVHPATPKSLTWARCLTPRPACWRDRERSAAALRPAAHDPAARSRGGSWHDWLRCCSAPAGNARRESAW